MRSLCSLYCFVIHVLGNSVVSVLYGQLRLQFIHDGSLVELVKNDFTHVEQHWNSQYGQVMHLELVSDVSAHIEHISIFCRLDISTAYLY